MLTQIETDLLTSSIGYNDLYYIDKHRVPKEILCSNYPCICY